MLVDEGTERRKELTAARRMLARTAQRVAPGDIEPPRCIAAAPDLAQNRELEDVGRRWDGKALSLLRARREQDGGAGIQRGECRRDGEIAAKVAEPETVVGVEEKAARLLAFRGWPKSENAVSCG